MPVFFGTPLQQPQNSSFAIDTSLSCLATSSSRCNNCTHKYYNERASRTARDSQIAQSMRFRAQMLTGDMVTDTVCLNDQSCLEATEFFEINYDFVSDYDGIFGLAPVDADEGPPFIKKLQSQGNITENSATLWLNQTAGLLILGEQAEDLLSSEWFSHRLYYNYDSCCSNPFWMLRLDNLYTGKQNILVGEDEPFDENLKQYAILESTSPFIFLKKAQFNGYIKQYQDLDQELDCDSGLVCRSSLPCNDLSTRVGGLSIEFDLLLYSLPPEALLQDHQDGCTLLVGYQKQYELQNAIVLGLPFLRGFTVSYHYDIAHLALAQSSQAIAGTKIESLVPVPLSWTQITMIIVCSIVGLIVAVFTLRCVIRCIRKKRREKYWREQEEQYTAINEHRQTQPKKSERLRKDVPQVEVDNQSTSGIEQPMEEKQEGKFVARWSRVIEVRDGKRGDQNSLKIVKKQCNDDKT